jgi:hypothetical protein
MKFPLLAAILFMTILFLACRRQGPDLGDVEGIVTLDGKPLVRASVVFEPKAGGRSSRAVTDETGRYHLIYLRDISGALIGSHKVKISTASEANPKEIVPVRYNKRSTLTADVAAGANRHNFNLSTR